MPVHAWSHFDAGIFHDFRLSWCAEIGRFLNQCLPKFDCYALSEIPAQALDASGLDMLGADRRLVGGKSGSALRLVPEPSKFRSPEAWYAAKANVIRIRHVSDHRVVAVIEIVSPGNKRSRSAMASFVEKAVALVCGGVHLLIVDLLPPGPRDPQGLHPKVWDEFDESDFTLPLLEPLTLASYRAGYLPEAFVETTAVGRMLPEMPVFLTPEHYISLPLEASYMSAWSAAPTFLQEEIAGTAAAEGPTP